MRQGGGVYFIGVDLAWGERKPSGLAVVDDRGHLVHVSAAGSDEEILEVLTPYALGDCLVAMDAPLIVVNPTGNRPAEKALNADFARFDAGAHPANTGKPEFADSPRGARLAAELGLDLDPLSTAPRRAIEVYPHPATVALFRLGRTLKYKNKPGRTLPELRAELLRLTGLVESLRDPGPGRPALHVAEHDGWRSLVALVETAATKAQLRHAEDQVDAVVCAYLALHAERAPDLTTTYGDGATGYIVTPTLPEGHTPSPRQPAVRERVTGEDRVQQAVNAYALSHGQVREATESYVRLLTTLLDDAGINYLSVTGRAKSVASFAAKAARIVDGRPMFPDPLRDIPDQIGLRVIVYLRTDVAAVAEVLSDHFVVTADRDMGQETASQGRFGYASRHLLVELDPARDHAPAAEQLRERGAQIQIRTVLQHAWAEFEHATRYKGTVAEEHAPDLDRRFTLAAGLLELADREFGAIHQLLQGASVAPAPEQQRAGGLSSEELAEFLTDAYSDAGWSRPDHYAWISGLLAELGITDVEELRGLLSSVDQVALQERMDYRYPAGAVRRLDDALLAVFGTRYVALSGNAHRAEALQVRLEKLRTT